MELLIEILLCRHVNATPDLLRDPDYVNIHRAEIDCAKQIIDNNWYKRDDTGGVVIDDGVGC
jgi:hypothetical protein